MVNEGCGVLLRYTDNYVRIWNKEVRVFQSDLSLTYIMKLACGDYTGLNTIRYCEPCARKLGILW